MSATTPPPAMRASLYVNGILAPLGLVMLAQESMRLREALLRKGLAETARAEQPGIDLLFSLARRETEKRKAETRKAEMSVAEVRA